MSNISDIFNLTDDTPVLEYKKGETIQRAGEKSSKTLYVKKGLLRSFTIDEKGKEHNFMFASEGWVISDIESGTANEPALLYIECIEDSEVILMDREKLDTISYTTQQYDKIIHSLFRRIAVMQKRIILMMSAPAKDRYLNFLDTYPELPNRLPQRMIASYLGITPEALSKIRGELIRN